MSEIKDSAYGWNDSLAMSLLEKLKSDLKQAMLSQNTVAKDTIRQIMSEFSKITMPIVLSDTGKKSTRPKRAEEISNDDIIDVIRGLIKSEKTVLELTKKEPSPYLVMLESYLPKMAAADEIKAWIISNIDLAQIKNPMQVMKPIMQHFGKKADGNLVKQILQELTT
ncbi:MAG: hypothetical protein A2511_15010 [Deltaproteobacteria bacterium RIFOXYD12_FULL_50_9]|nr:MAG: hypothetical protein A2511_15010 [Deltaproteobacteria bacterium RIFOXYD12_FULL_50_9]